MDRKRHGSLFSGIGGFDLAATWMGWDNIFQVEISAFCNTVLAYHFPGTKRYKDVKKFRGEKYHGAIDILSAGFPCQPFSTAGKRRGKADDRFLWPEALRIINEIQPRWIILENVAGLFSILEPTALSRMEIEAVELFCQDATRQPNKTVLSVQRRIIGTIVDQIGAAGYILPTLTDGTPILSCVPACALGAPHRRDRLWIVAHAGGLQKRGELGDMAGRDHQGRQGDMGHPTQHSHPAESHRGRQAGTDADSDGQHQRHRQDEKQLHQAGQHALDDAEPRGSAATAAATGRWQDARPYHQWDTWPAQSPFCGRNDGVFAGLDTISFSKWRTESIHGLGNAIVPQVAFEIFRAIGQADTDK